MPTPDTSTLPLFPLGTVLFPTAPLPLHIFEERYRRMMADHRDADPIFGVVLTRTGNEVGDQPTTHEIGTSASIINLRPRPNGSMDIAVVGRRRFRVLDGHWREGYLTAEIEWLADEPGDVTRDQLFDLRRGTIAAFTAFIAVIASHLGGEPPEETFPDDPTETSYSIAARVPLQPRERQALLELSTTAERLAALSRTLVRERKLLSNTGALGGIDGPPLRRFNPN